MSATVVSLPTNTTAETLDFLRRLASMLKGGRSGEMLLQAASMIEQLSHRAISAEQLYHAQQEESTRNVETRTVAEIAADRLLSEVDVLKARLVASTRQAEIERDQFAGEARRLVALAQDAEARLAQLNAELDELHQAAETPKTDVDLVTVPAQPLRLARAQFDFLADGFARSGDVISQTICEIGRCAIDQALTHAPLEEGR